MKIYLDLDGVLADFDKQYTKLFGDWPEDVDKRHKHFYKHWDEFASGDNFEKLELLPDATILLKAVDTLKVPVEILSSSSGGKYHEDVTKQKLIWLKKHNINYKANIVKSGEDKAKFAAPWNILIDDTPLVVEAYRKAGGTAILHKNAHDTIKKLYELYLEWMGGQ